MKRLLTILSVCTAFMLMSMYAYDPNSTKTLFKNDPTMPMSVNSTTANVIYQALPTTGLNGAYLGIRANTMKVGDIFELKVWGNYVTPTVPGAARVRVSLGGTNGIDVTVNASILATSSPGLPLIAIVSFQCVSISGTTATVKVNGRMSFMTTSTGAEISGSTSQTLGTLSSTISVNPTIDLPINVPASFSTTSANQGTTVDAVLLTQY